VTDFRAHAVSGVKWTGGATGVGLVLQFTQMAVLAQYLSTEAFGLFGETMVVVGVALTFVDLGMSPALVQADTFDDRVTSSLFWLVAAVSAGTGVVVWLSTPLIATFFGEPQLSELIWVGGAFVTVFGLGQVPQAVLQRELAFDRLSRVEILSAVFGVTTAVSCAIGGLDAHAPLFGLLVSGVTRFVGLIAYSLKFWRPQLRFRMDEARRHLSFGAFQTGERLVSYLAANLDFVIIGRYAGAAALGPYYVAYQVVVQPMLRLNPILTRVAFPLFSRIQDDETITRGYLKILKLVSLVSAPALVGIAVVAPSFFDVYLGPQWSEIASAKTVVLAQILVPVALLKCLGNPTGSAFLAKGRPDLGFWLNAVRLVLNAAMFWWAIQHSLEAVAAVYAASTVLAFVASQFVLGGILPLKFGYVTRAAIPSLLVACGMGIIVALAQLGLTGISVDPLHKLIFLISLGGTVYLLGALQMDRPLLIEIQGWVAGRETDA